jgi:hypothetical protein
VSFYRRSGKKERRKYLHLSSVSQSNLLVLLSAVLRFGWLCVWGKWRVVELNDHDHDHDHENAKTWRTGSSLISSDAPVVWSTIAGSIVMLFANDTVRNCEVSRAKGRSPAKWEVSRWDAFRK